MARKRSLRVVNEHFEPFFNAAWSSAVVFIRSAARCWLSGLTTTRRSRCLSMPSCNLPLQPASRAGTNSSPPRI
ncbi:hypothetical protein CXP40_22465 [Pseudomonas sp. YY-1]|nr:hypothetical protein CXP40_22465 [Pseudomonas sp. YY-1]